MPSGKTGVEGAAADREEGVLLVHVPQGTDGCLRAVKAGPPVTIAALRALFPPVAEPGDICTKLLDMPTSIAD